MNGIDTILCPKKLQWTLFLGITVALLIDGCRPIQENAQNRPSPLTTDSLIMENGKIWIAYSSPAVRDREIWGVLDPYDKVWRIGANDATVFSTDFDLMIQDSLLLPKGKYSLFTIPREGDWTIIFNKEWDQWGAYNYDEAYDQLRFDLTPYKTDDKKERLTFSLAGDGISFHWEYLKFDIPYSIR